MIKQIRASYYHNKKNTQYCCLSTDIDTLPDYLQNGDEVYFIDTGKNYLYNATTGELVEDKSGGSGLPDITNADNGKVLTAKDGDWIPQSNVYIIPLVRCEDDTTIVPQSYLGDLLVNYVNYENFIFKLYSSNVVDDIYYMGAVPAKKADWYGLPIIVSEVLKDGLLYLYSDIYTGSDNGNAVQIWIPLFDLFQYHCGVVRPCSEYMYVNLYVNSNNLPTHMDKTAKEISDAVLNYGKEVLFNLNDSNGVICAVRPTLFTGTEINGSYILSLCGHFIKPSTGIEYVFYTGNSTVDDDSWYIKQYNLADTCYVVKLAKNVDVDGNVEITADKSATEVCSVLNSGEKNVVFLLNGIKGHYYGIYDDYYVVFPVTQSNRNESCYIVLNNNGYFYQYNYECPDLIASSLIHTDNNNLEKVMMLDDHDEWPYWESVERLYPIGSLLTDLLIAAMSGLAGNNKVAYTAIYKDTNGAWKLVKDICNSFSRGRGTIITMNNVANESEATGIRVIGYDSSNYSSGDDRGTIIVRFSGTLFNSNVDENTTNQDLYNFDIYLQSQCLGPVDEEPIKTYAVSIIGEKINSTVIINDLQQQ